MSKDAIKNKQKEVVLVNSRDEILGLKEKFACHKNPVPLHRAISILIFDKNKEKMLITKRALEKPTWGGVWSNAVCTHPYPEETYQKAAERRLFEELGVKTPLNELFTFIYEAKMKGSIWGEHELDHVFTGMYDERVIKPDPNEVSDYKWIKLEDLRREIEENPEKYTPWFKIIMNRLDV